MVRGTKALAVSMMINTAGENNSQQFFQRALVGMMRQIILN